MNTYTTIPAPGPGEDTEFTNEVWHDFYTGPGSMQNIILEEGWSEIGWQAFVNNPDLLSIRIPASVVNILEDAFKGAINLRQVEFAQGSRLEFIGEDAFNGAVALERINIPAGVTDLGDATFLGATSLEQVTFEEGSQLEMIGFQTFAETRALQTIRIPASVASIDVEAFHNATSLIEVIFEEGSKLEFIGDGAFSDTRALQTIQIPTSVGYIGQGAFRNASSLQTIHIPKLVDNLMIFTFENATSLREVTFEEDSDLISIGDGAFMGATALQTIRIPEGVMLIRQGAFVNARSLQTIYFPKSVREIGERAFAITSNLREITFEQDSEITRIGYDAFRGSGLNMVVIGESALNRLNADAKSRNLSEIASSRRPLRLLSYVEFRENNNFYGADYVTIVSRAQQIDTLQLITKKSGYKKPPKTGFIRSLAETLRLKKPAQKTRPPLPEAVTREIGKYLMPAGVEPKSPAALAARKGGARKPKTRKRGARKTQKRKSKRRRTIKRK